MGGDGASRQDRSGPWPPPSLRMRPFQGLTKKTTCAAGTACRACRFFR